MVYNVHLLNAERITELHINVNEIPHSRSCEKSVSRARYNVVLAQTAENARVGDYRYPLKFPNPKRSGNRE